MPTYDYECKSCGHTFEEFQSFKDKVRRKCPECGKLSLERLIGSGGAVIFKGSGFYVTDYRSKEYQEKAKADQDAQKSSETGSSGSSASGDSKSGSSSKKSDGESKTGESKTKGS